MSSHSDRNYFWEQKRDTGPGPGNYSGNLESSLRGYLPSKPGGNNKTITQTKPDNFCDMVGAWGLQMGHFLSWGLNKPITTP